MTIVFLLERRSCNEKEASVLRIGGGSVDVASYRVSQRSKKLHFDNNHFARYGAADNYRLGQSTDALQPEVRGGNECERPGHKPSGKGRFGVRSRQRYQIHLPAMERFKQQQPEKFHRQRKFHVHGPDERSVQSRRLIQSGRRARDRRRLVQQKRERHADGAGDGRLHFRPLGSQRSTSAIRIL